MLLDTLGAGLFGNLLTGKGAIATSQGCKPNMPGQSTIRVDESTVRAGRDL